MHVFGVWKEVRLSRENPCTHGKKMQIPQMDEWTMCSYLWSWYIEVKNITTVNCVCLAVTRQTPSTVVLWPWTKSGQMRNSSSKSYSGWRNISKKSFSWAPAASPDLTVTNGVASRFYFLSLAAHAPSLHGRSTVCFFLWIYSDSFSSTDTALAFPYSFHA